MLCIARTPVHIPIIKTWSIFHLEFMVAPNIRGGEFFSNISVILGAVPTLYHIPLGQVLLLLLCKT